MHPTINDAKNLATRYRKPAVIVVHLSLDGSVGFASYGMTRKQCDVAGVIGEQIIERIMDGTIDPVGKRPTRAKSVPAAPPAPTPPAPPSPPKPPPQRPEWAHRLDQCDEILSAIDDLPDRAADFAASVQEKVESIRDWIEAQETVTSAQCAALDNMERGVHAWLER